MWASTIMSSTAKRSSLLVGALGLLLAGTQTGCDVVDAGTFELPDRRVTFEFVFQGGALQPGWNEISSVNQVDLVAYVQQRGFTTADVVSARVRTGSAQLRVARPLTAGVNSFLRVDLAPVRAGVIGPVLVSGDGFTGTGEIAGLQVATANFADLLVAGPLRGRLRVDPALGVIQSGEYRVEVSFDVVISVEA